MMQRIRTFADPAPSTLYWDASFIVNFAYGAAKYFQECFEFLGHLDEMGTISYVSTLALDEACFVLLQLRVEEDHGKRKFWNVYNADPSVIRPYLPDLRVLIEQIYAHPRIRLVGVEPLFALESLAYMEEFHFLPRDAYHLSTIRHYGVDGLVTLDADFLGVEDLVIYTCAPSILGRVSTK